MKVRRKLIALFVSVAAVAAIGISTAASAPAATTTGFGVNYTAALSGTGTGTAYINASRWYIYPTVGVSGLASGTYSYSVRLWKDTNWDGKVDTLQTINVCKFTVGTSGTGSCGMSTGSGLGFTIDGGTAEVKRDGGSTVLSGAFQKA